MVRTDFWFEGRIAFASSSSLHDRLGNHDHLTQASRVNKHN
jgi:hypothetical protein